MSKSLDDIHKILDSETEDNSVKHHKQHGKSRFYMLVCGLCISLVLVLVLFFPVISNRLGFSLDKAVSDSKDLVAVADVDPPAFDYWYAPENSFGIRETKTINRTTFWNLFRSHSMWQLEAQHPVTLEWLSEWDGQNLNTWLDIERTPNADNTSEKINLTVNNNHPSQALKFRFTFAIDIRVKQFINESSTKWNYILTFQANETEDYNVFFNFSDLKPLVQDDKIHVKHGVKTIGEDEYFWFRIIANQTLNAGNSFTVDPNFGDEDQGGEYIGSLGAAVAGTLFTLSEGASATSMTANIYTFSNLLVLVLLDDGKNVLGETEELEPTADDEWVEFNFDTPIILSPGDYWLCIWGSDISQVLNYDASGGNGVHWESEPYDGSITDPLTLGSTEDADGKSNIFCTYDIYSFNAEPTVDVNTPSNSTGYCDTDTVELEVTVGDKDANNNMNLTFYVDGVSVDTSHTSVPNGTYSYNWTATTGYHIWNVSVGDGTVFTDTADYNFNVEYSNDTFTNANNISNAYNVTLAAGTYTVDSSGGGGVGDDVGTLGTWTEGTTVADPAGSNRLMVVYICAYDATDNHVVTSVEYGGEAMTAGVEYDLNDAGVYLYNGMYYLNDAGITAASDNNIVVTWDATPDDEEVGTQFFANVSQADPIGNTCSDYDDTAGEDIVSCAVAAGDGDLITMNGVEGRDDETRAVGGGFTTIGEYDGDAMSGLPSVIGVAAFHKIPSATSETATFTSLGPRNSVTAMEINIAPASGGATYYEGNISSDPISKDTDGTWDKIYYHMNTTDHATVNISDYATGTPLLSDVASGADISSLTNATLGIRIDFDNATALYSWNISWTCEVAGWSNSAPNATGEHPTNGSVDQDLQIAVGCTIEDGNPNHTLNVTFATNVSGSFVNMQTNSSISPDGAVNWTYGQANSASTKYYWRVYVHDGFDNTSWTFHYTTGANVSARGWQELLTGYLLGGNATVTWDELFSGWLTGGNDTVIWSELFSGYLTGGNVSVEYTELFTGYLTGGNISTYDELFDGYLTGGNATISWTELLTGWLSGGNDTVVWNELFNGYLTGGNISSYQELFNGYLTGGNITTYQELFTGYITGGNASIDQNELFSGYLSGGNISSYEELFSGWLSGGNVSRTWRESFDGWVSGGNISVRSWNESFDGWLSGGNHTGNFTTIIVMGPGGRDLPMATVFLFVGLMVGLFIPINIFRKWRRKQVEKK